MEGVNFVILCEFHFYFYFGKKYEYQQLNFHPNILDQNVELKLNIQRNQTIRLFWNKRREFRRAQSIEKNYNATRGTQGGLVTLKHTHISNRVAIWTVSI